MSNQFLVANYKIQFRNQRITKFDAPIFMF